MFTTIGMELPTAYSRNGIRMVQKVLMENSIMVYTLAIGHGGILIDQLHLKENLLWGILEIIGFGLLRKET